MELIERVKPIELIPLIQITYETVYLLPNELGDTFFNHRPYQHLHP